MISVALLGSVGGSGVPLPVVQRWFSGPLVFPSRPVDPMDGPSPESSASPSFSASESSSGVPSDSTDSPSPGVPVVETTASPQEVEALGGGWTPAKVDGLLLMMTLIVFVAFASLVGAWVRSA